MKKYIKPKTKAIVLDPEDLLQTPTSLNPFEGGDGLSKRNTFVTDDEYLGSDISYNKGVFRSAEENSDDATVVNHY
ncbi:MAG: hypothetical protein MJZ29_04220 [Bacteroidaceae bacterium]|nr:hypothetical protein [Bacteroidaceae bacterium]